jgi:hypothetical protein
MSQSLETAGDEQAINGRAEQARSVEQIQPPLVAGPQSTLTREGTAKLVPGRTVADPQAFNPSAPLPPARERCSPLRFERVPQAQEPRQAVKFALHNTST